MVKAKCLHNLHINNFLSSAPKNGGQVIEELISESGYGLTGFKNVFGPESVINDSYRVRRKNRK